MNRLAALAVLLTLTACGADGAPERPTPNLAETGLTGTGLTISARTEIGLARDGG